MCQSAKTSLVAWVVAVVIALLIISTGKRVNKWNGYFILTFILVQFLEFMIWRERGREGLTTSASEALKEGPESKRNAPSSETFTRLILIALWLQPLVQTFMAYRHGNPKYKPQLLVATIAFFVMFIWSIVKATDYSEKFQSRPFVGCGDTCNIDGPCPGGHLQWTRSKTDGFVGPALSGYLYVFGLIFGLLFMTPGIFGVMQLILGLILLVYSSKQLHSEEKSSMWCIYAVFYAFLALIIAFSRKNLK